MANGVTKILKNGRISIPIDREIQAALLSAVRARFTYDDDQLYTRYLLAEIAKVLKQSLIDCTEKVKFTPAQFFLLSHPKTMMYISAETQILLRGALPQHLKIDIEIY